MAKKLKIKLPKRVAGVKIPKSVRKGPIAGFLNSSGGQLILAQTLVAAAGVFAASKTDPDSKTGEFVRHPVSRLKQVGRSAAGFTADQRARLSFALQEAARAFKAAMERNPAAEPVVSEIERDASTHEEPIAKKKPSSRSEANVPH